MHLKDISSFQVCYSNLILMRHIETARTKLGYMAIFILKKKKIKNPKEMKQDFPRSCCCMICWWIIMYCSVPMEDRHPQLGWLQSSVPTCFFKKKASSNTPLGTHGVRIKPVAITMALILFPSFIFAPDVKKDGLGLPNQFHISSMSVFATTSVLHSGPSIWTSAADLWPGSISQTPQSQPQRSQSGKLQPRKTVYG